MSQAMYPNTKESSMGNSLPQANQNVFIENNTKPPVDLTQSQLAAMVRHYQSFFFVKTKKKIIRKVVLEPRTQQLEAYL
jgi:hypothetical protein